MSRSLKEITDSIPVFHGVDVEWNVHSGIRYIWNDLSFIIFTCLNWTTWQFKWLDKGRWVHQHKTVEGMNSRQVV